MFLIGQWKFMVEDDPTRIKHIFDACNEILQFTDSISKSQFKKNKILAFASIHLIEIIGEAANSVTSEFTQKYQNIPWKHIIGMRNRLIHGYFDIDLDIVWQTIKEDIPNLLKKVENIFNQEKWDKPKSGEKLA